MPMRVRLDDDEGVEIQMAPLIDCMFLLLIFFLVATTLKTVVRELPIDLPYVEAAVQSAEEPDLLAIGLDTERNLYVNGTPANRELVIDLLRNAQQKERPVRLDADREVPYEAVLELIELCHIQGISHVGFHTRKTRR